MIRIASLMIALLMLPGSAFAAYWEPAELLGLTGPVTVEYLGECADGGSTKGKLVGAKGEAFHFFIDRRMRTQTYNRWYVGSEFNTGKAELLEDADGRIGAIHALVAAWLDGETTAEERSQLEELDAAPLMAKNLSPSEKMHEHAKWFAAARFKQAKEDLSSPTSSSLIPALYVKTERSTAMMMQTTTYKRANEVILVDSESMAIDQTKPKTGRTQELMHDGAVICTMRNPWGKLQAHHQYQHHQDHRI